MPNNNNNNFENGYVAWNRDYTRPPSSSPKFTPYSSRESSPPFMPSSPTSSSSPILSTSPPISLRRTFSSTFSLIPEDRAVDQPIIITQTFPRRSSNEARFIRLIFWWPLFFIGFLQLLYQYLRNNFQRAFVVLMPTFWLSAALCLFYKMINLPLLLVNELLIRIHTTPKERNRKKRTILISGGSSIQTLHQARNFYSSGSRVVVFDFDGLFPLSKYSTSVSKYYTVPNPATSINDYISAICEIVLMENVSFYIPVSVSNSAYYDALVKPHLELLGCQTFVSGIHELAVLDDILEILEKCQENEIPVPTYKILHSKEDLQNVYDCGWLSGFRNLIMSVGHFGRIERLKFELPLNRRDLRFGYEISEKRPWIVVQDVPGNHYLTCTTVKESKMITNVTCAVQLDTKNLLPESNEEVEKWLKDFFNKIRFQRPVNGHFSFRLVKCMNTGNLLPIGIRVGVSLPYLCHTSAHSKLLWKSCPHFSRQNSGPLVQQGGRYWIHQALLRTVKHLSVESVTNLIGTVLDKREALFLYWDPLPYCAYYHFQLPLKSIRDFLQRRRNRPAVTPPRTGYTLNIE